ncbi:MAG TPA: Wzz/FepE/Etk N-terminal domain-containing protein [Longimicrobiales bacterium]|nr:Wzz/FepE/Etk N-terminal domain-containing protein [Longimicrobiales bacterium]
MSASPGEVAALLLRRWPLVLGTPLAMGAVALAFALVVPPRFEAATAIRVVEDEEPLGTSLTGAAQGGGGVGILSALTGRGVPLQTEMAVLSSRGLAEELVEDLGLRLEVREPRKSRRSDVVSKVDIPLEGPEGELVLRRGADGRFTVTGKLLAERDPFRVVRAERWERRELGTVAPGEALALEGTEIVLAEGAAAHDRIVLRLLSRDRAMERLEDELSVTRPQRDADVLRVALTWTDPYLAADAVNRLVSIYLAYREDVRVRQAGRSSAFLAEQLDSLRGELETAEEELRRYREARHVLAPEAQVSAEVEQLADLKGRRELLQAERTALTELIAALDAEPAGASQRRVVFFPTLLQSQATAELLRLLGELETQRAELLDRRTEDAREVMLLTSRIEGLEAELRSVAETYLQGLGEQVSALDATLSGFEARLEPIPEVEMEYARRLRQVELLTQLALFLETRQKEAELASVRQGVGAYVLAPARPPQEPASPRPKLTLGLALFVGLLLGITGAVLLERPVPVRPPA